VYREKELDGRKWYRQRKLTEQSSFRGQTGRRLGIELEAKKLKMS
jgi:hypothetical protein